MRRRFLCPVIVAAVCLSVTVTTSAAEPKKIVAIEGITEYRLDNGVLVLLFPDNSKPTVTVNLTVLVGSRHEGYGETGMAHLLEHMVFKGTPTFPNVPKELRDRGAQFNGSTSYDRTNYYETMPANDSNLEFGIKLEADRLVNSYVKREDLLSEFSVVRNEFEIGENNPSRVLMQRMMASAFEWHNYGKSTIGNRSDIERVPIDNLQAFYKRFYQPDNVMLVIAGQFDEAKALGYIQKYFGTIPKPKRQLDKTYTEEPAQDGERFVTLRRVGDVGAVGAVYHVPSGSHAEFPAVQVLAQILADEPAGRLYKALVETKKATQVSGFAFPLHDPGVLLVNAEVRRGSSLEAARDALFAVAEEVSAKGVTDEEVERAKAQVLKQRELAAANSQQIAVQLSEWAAQGDWRLYFLHRDRIEKVTAADVKTVAAKYLMPNNRTIGMFIPTEKPERVAVPATPDVKALVVNYKGRATIAEGEKFDATPLAIEARTKRWQLPNGVKVALLPKKTRGEAVHVQLTLRYGNAENLNGLTTAATFLPRLMQRGTKQKTYQQIQDELDKLKATMSGSGDTGSVTFSIQTKRANLPAVLRLLREILREPSLPAVELEVIKRESLARMERARSDPMMLGMLRLRQVLSPYPKDDVRYVASADENIQRIQAVSLEQIKQLYQEYLNGQFGELAVVGDFDADEVTRAVKEALDGWKAIKPYARIEVIAHPDVTPGKETINTPDKANAAYFAGLELAMNDEHPDFPALLIADYILGGGTLSSRLGDRVRQKEGLSYGVRSNFNAQYFDRRASLNIMAFCNPINIEKVEKAIREELDRLITSGVTADELAKAKQAFLQQYRVVLAQDRMLMVFLNTGTYEGRTLAYYADLDKKMEALTPEHVQAALKKHIDPNKLFIVTAGDFSKKLAETAK